MDVFISYEHQSKPIADNICAVLESRGIRCWYAPRDVYGDYATSIVEAIENCKVFVLILNCDSSNSPHVLNEVEMAYQRILKGEIAIVPFKVDAGLLSKAMEYYVKRLHWIDAVSEPLEKAIARLYEQLVPILGLKPQPAALPDPDCSVEVNLNRRNVMYYSPDDLIELKRLGMEEELLYEYEKPYYDKLLLGKSGLVALDLSVLNPHSPMRRLNRGEIDTAICLSYNAAVVKEGNDLCAKDGKLKFFEFNADEQDIADYNKALDKYEKAEDEYAEHAEELKSKIMSIAESMYPDDSTRRDSFLSRTLAAYGLGGDSDNTELIGPQPLILPKDFDRQVEEAKAAAEEARKELSDLMKGILPENAAADFDFASAIEEAGKKLKEAEEKYFTLTGYDPKSAEKTAAELADVMKRIEDEEYELKKSSTTDRIQLLELEKQHALEALHEELEAAKLVYEALGKDTAELEAAYAKLSELTGKRYDIEISNERDEQTENSAEELQSLLSQYQDYAAKRKSIEEQYNEDIRKLQEARTDENAAEIDSAIAEAKRQMNDELFSIDRSNGEVFSKIFGSIPDMTRQQIREAIALARQELAKLDEDASPEAFKAISDALHELEDADINWDTSGWVSGFDNVAKKLNEIIVLKKRAESAEASGDTAYVEELNSKIRKSQDDLKKGLVATGVSTFVNGLQKASEYMKQIAEYSGDTRLGEMGEQIGALAQNLSAAGQGAAQGGWIGAIVGGVTDIINQTIEAFASARLEQEEFLANQRDFAREYAAIQRELKDEDYESIFGTREISKVSDAWKKARETMEEYNDAVNKEMEKPEEEYDYNSLGAGIFLLGSGIGGWGWGKSLTNEYKSKLEAYRKGYTELQGMQVKVKDYSGWANFWGKKDEFMSLKDLAPELWDENGVFQVDAAEAFLETNTQISDEQRKQIQNLIDMKGEYDDLIDQVDQYLASIFGNVSQEISDAIFDAVLNGADAWDSFEDTAISVIDKIGRQMVQEFVVQAYLDTFQDRLRDAVGSDNPSEDLSDIMMEIYSGLGGVLEEGTEAYSEWLEYMKEQGLDITKLYEERAGSTKGVAQASQESVDYLNGLMTNVNDNVFSLSENVKVLAGYNKMMLMVTTQIEANTRPIGNILSFLYTIYDEVHAARKAMDDQGTRGIKIR